jgi:hypothetical protein
VVSSRAWASGVREGFQAFVIFRAQAVDEGFRAFELGMIFSLSRPLGLPERSEQVAALDLLPDDFGEKGAAAAFADQAVDLGEEVFGQNDMSAFASHG